ncbi:MAG: ABC transporter permease [Dehalococcoidales bacterium]|nr:ABC transporter permease [Dehalococcoidales bacterium]
MKQLRNAWFLMVKDLKLFTADRTALFFAILFPFLFVVLFNLVMTGVMGEDQRLVINLATREPAGGISYQLISAMETKDKSALKPGEPQIVWLKDYEQAKQDVENKKLDGFVAFPEDFTEAISMGYGTELEVLYNPNNTQVTAALQGIARSIASQIGTRQVVNDTVIGLLMEKELMAPGSSGDLTQIIRSQLTGQGSDTTTPSMISFSTREIGEVKAENPANFVIPGYLVMFVFFTAAFSAAQLVKERQNHTLERLLSSSATKTAILGGVYGGTVAKGLIQIVIFWAVGILGFKMDLGISPLAVILISILMTLMASAFGVMLATFVKTEKSASSIGVLTSLILAPLGGCWWPLFITPKWMQLISKITPHAWATTAFNKLLVFGSDFDSVVPNMLVLAGFMVVFGVIAILRFRTDAE